MTNSIATAALLVLLVGCGGPQQDAPAEPLAGTPAPASAPMEAPESDAEAASQTLDEMLTAARAGDFGVYVDKYYGEADKFGSPADRDALVRRFEEKWKDKIVEALARASELPVKIDGDQALFLDGEEPVFVLYRHEDGWKFHL